MGFALGRKGRRIVGVLALGVTPGQADKHSSADVIPGALLESSGRGSAKQFGQYHGAGVLTGFGLLLRQLAQR
jgi:hypothetical protein